MAYKAIVTRLSNVRPHPNADKVQLATCHGNQVVIGLDTLEGQLGVYFPSDGQLSHEFCYANNLYREAALNKYPEDKCGMFDSNRRVKAQKFRGEISDGFWVPLQYFEFIQATDLDVDGFEFDEWKGIPICCKYINPATAKIARENQGKKSRTEKASVMFKEHFDTSHFGKNIHEFKIDDTIIITEKLHGTSGRVGFVQVERNLSLLERIAKFVGVKVQETEWVYMHGTRRVILNSPTQTQYHDPAIRSGAFQLFNGKLKKGETVYFEIVGFETNGVPIQPDVCTKGLNDKIFTTTYGETMSYSYGCYPEASEFTKQFEVYVYRITFTNEDGQSIDYAWNDVVERCSEIGVKSVPEIATITLNQIAVNNDIYDVEDRLIYDTFSKLVERAASGISIIDPRHIKEGVCVRIEGGLHNRTFKFKSFEFKVLEGIVKDSGVVDIEEAQSVM